MPAELKIDFVSDVVCPWCAIGLCALERALERVREEGITASIRFQPFELNPQMGPQGEDIIAHLSAKYGIDPEQARASQETIRARGEQVGFAFDMARRTRTYNTFDAHRLLHWAELEGQERQQALKHALLEAYFTHGRNPGDHAVLVEAAERAGLDGQRAREVLEAGAFGDETRARERFYLDLGIHSVPAVIVNERYLIQGGQPVEAFEQALRQIARES